MILIACGAYCRPATEKDWEDGKDFQALTTEHRGRYFSIRDCKMMAEEFGITKIIFRDRLFTKDLFIEKI
jgi:hypothetical protein